jgi:hypothetical protein
MFAYDAGLTIDLDSALRLLSVRPDETSRETIKRSRRTPEYFDYRPAPLRVVQHSEPITLGKLSTRASVECTIFDFGAISVEYTIPFEGGLELLLDLSDALYENEALLADSRWRVERLLHTIGSAVREPHLSQVVEDYAVFHVHVCDVPPAELLPRHAPMLARILRAERDVLSQQEVDEALSTRVSYSERDLAILDWNAAIVIDDDAADTLAVLEFVNIELLEMRLLDDRLDTSLEEAYRIVESRRGLGGVLALAGGGKLRHISALQMDAAMLFEGVNNALKLVGDQYLARLYKLASGRLHLSDWDASILRKLATLESIYGKLLDRRTTRRMEVLEAIIILLFVVSIVLPFVTSAAK